MLLATHAFDIHTEVVGQQSEFTNRNFDYLHLAVRWPPSAEVCHWQNYGAYRTPHYFIQLSEVTTSIQNLSKILDRNPKLLKNLQTLILQAPMRCANQTDEYSPFFADVMGLMDSLKTAYASHDLEERYFHPILQRGSELAGSPVIVKIWIVNKRVMTLFLNHDETVRQPEMSMRIHALRANALMRFLVDEYKSSSAIESQLLNPDKDLRSFAATPSSEELHRYWLGAAQLRWQKALHPKYEIVSCSQNLLIEELERDFEDE